MGWLLVLVRRSLWLLLISAVGALIYSWWRDRSTVESVGPPEWPPLPATPESPVERSSANASFVNALVDAPEARSSNGATGGWVAPTDDGSCPLSHPIKANDNSGIFHVPDGRFYNRTKAERCYQSAEAAVADGYRQAKN
jgi:hypothetical protein